jgi:1-acyl-sn-glycerol-3-phosphate acyltransferase
MVIPVIIFGLILKKPAATSIRLIVRLYGYILIRVVPFMAPVTIEYRAGKFKEPVIFASNHYSSIDPYLFGMLPCEMVFVTSWPFRIPVYKWIMGIAKYINSLDGWDVLEEQGSQLLNNGCSLVIWPEGHRSRDGRTGRFKNGAFRLACKTGKPVVPICVKGSDKVLSPGQRLLNPARVKVVVLKPIEPPDSDTPENIKNLKDMTREAIVTELLQE